MFAPYPRPDERFFNEAAEQKMNVIIRTVRAVRDVRNTFSVPASAEVELIIVTANKNEAELFATSEPVIKRLSRANPIKILEQAAQPARAATLVIDSAKIFVPLGNVIDVEKAKVKLEQRKTSIEKDVARGRQQLDNPDFKAKAPQDKVAAAEAQLTNLENQLKSVEEQLKVLES